MLKTKIYIHIFMYTSTNAYVYVYCDASVIFAFRDLKSYKVNLGHCKYLQSLIVNANKMRETYIRAVKNRVANFGK